jgi:hypothetical protein
VHGGIGVPHRDRSCLVTLRIIVMFHYTAQMSGSLALTALLLSAFTPAVVAATPMQSGTMSAARCGSPALQTAADASAAKFDDHQFVSIGSTHQDAKIEAFLACLVTDRPFSGERPTSSANGPVPGNNHCSIVIF